MTNESGGNPRFKGPGMQWKTPWKKHAELLPNMPFIEGFRFGEGGAAGYYAPGVKGGPPVLLGTGAGFWRGAVIFVRPGAATFVQEAVGCTQAPAQPAAAVGGWRIYFALDGSLKFEVGDTLGNFVTATTSGSSFAVLWESSPDQITPALVLPMLAIFRGDGTSLEIRPGRPTSLFTNTFVGSAYAPPTTGQQHDPTCCLGDDMSATHSPAVHLGINGMVGGEGIPSAGQISQWFADVKSQLTTPQIPGMTDDQWTANASIGVNAWQAIAPVTLPDLVDGGDMTKITALLADLTITNYQVEFDY